MPSTLHRRLDGNQDFGYRKTFFKERKFRKKDEKCGKGVRKMKTPQISLYRGSNEQMGKASPTSQSSKFIKKTLKINK